MAGRLQRSESDPVAPSIPARPTASSGRPAGSSGRGGPGGSSASGGSGRADLRRWIYAGLDVVFAAAHVVALWSLVPNRLPSASVHLWTFPLAHLAMAAGMMLGRPRGWWLAVIGGSLALASVALLIVRIAISAAFLAGVYGAFGKAAATFALVMIALVIELVALLPAVQVKYLLTRAGRRALGMPAR